MINCCISDITVKQIELMQHAIGFPKNRVTGTKHRVMHAYRNYFCDTKCNDWEALVEKGLARRGEPNKDGILYYSVTLEGLVFLGNLCGLKIIETD